MSTMSPAVPSNTSSAPEAAEASKTSEPERQLNVRLEELNTNTRGDQTNQSVINRSWRCVCFNHILFPDVITQLCRVDWTNCSKNWTDLLRENGSAPYMVKYSFIHSDELQDHCCCVFLSESCDCDFIYYWSQIRYWSSAADWTPASFTWTSWGESVQVSHMMWWRQQSRFKMWEWELMISSCSDQTGRLTSVEGRVDKLKTENTGDTPALHHHQCLSGLSSGGRESVCQNFRSQRLMNSVWLNSFSSEWQTECWWTTTARAADWKHRWATSNTHL